MSGEKRSRKVPEAVRPLVPPATPPTEAERGRTRPNKCGVGAHYPGRIEYRVIQRPTWKPDEWITGTYTEFLDKALDECWSVRTNGGNAYIERAEWTVEEL